MKSRNWKAIYLDWFINITLLLAGLVAYTYTLAPTLLQGDSALFQYTPQVLGVTYPTGFPTYLLVAKGWLTLLPWGEVAWRMNFFSAMCASLALPILYGVARRVWHNRLAALTAVIIFATLPTYWRWATVARVYTFNILLFSIVLWLALWDKQDDVWLVSRFTFHVSRFTFTHRYKLAAFVLGVQVGGHNTTVLLIPGILLLFWLDFKSRQSKTTEYNLPGSFEAPSARRSGKIMRHLSQGIARLASGKVNLCTKIRRSRLRFWLTPVLFFLLPLTAYLYVPLRAEWLVAQYGREGAVVHGLVPDFYRSGLSGLIRYFTAADFTGGVVSNWGDVPADFVAVYLPLLRQDFTWLGIVLGVIGGLIMAWRRPRFFWPLLVIYLVPIPFVLTYGRGEQSAFLLTSDLAFALFAGGVVVLANIWAERLIYPKSKTPREDSVFAPYPSSFTFHISRFTFHVSHFTFPPLFGVSLFALILIILPYRQAQHSTEWLRHKWDSAMYDYWRDVLNHPLEPGGGIMATWGDLTSMWYMQHVEGRRPDLRGVYPPEEEVAAAWLAQGRDLYVAGPILETWDPGLMDRYHVLPWGRLVRLAPLSDDPQALLPTLPQRPEATFGRRLYLAGASFESNVEVGDTLYAFFAWQALADLPERTRYSLRLVQAERIVAQKDDTLASGWFPLDYLPAGQPLLGAYPLELPPGTLPGIYRLQLAVYNRVRESWPLADGSPVLDLGPVKVRFTPATTPPGPLRFNGELALDEFNFSVSRVKQGKGFALETVWRALKPPADNYTLLVELADRQGRVWRDWRQPLKTATWLEGQQVRHLTGVTIPAEAPTGEEALAVRLSWLRPDDSRLKATRWLIPIGRSITLKGPRILPKDNRLWEQPLSQYTVEANFENKAALVGYDLPEALTISTDMPATLSLTLYWQGRGDMAQGYLAFVHLLDAEGNIVAQHDGVPARGKEPTTSWAVGEYIRDPIEIQLPAGFEPGTYTVVAGLYLPPGGPRLVRLDDRVQVIGDSVQLGKIQLEPEQ
jgi:hypothetical protein